MAAPVVLITGALTGIGRATALAFAQEGARVVVSGRRDEEGKKLVGELRKYFHVCVGLGQYTSEAAQSCELHGLPRFYFPLTTIPVLAAHNNGMSTRSSR